jgi:pterin-4a-carbinolamine dehydratase
MRVTQKRLIKPVIYTFLAVLAHLLCHRPSLRFLYNRLTFHAIEHDSRGNITQSYR